MKKIVLLVALSLGFIVSAQEKLTEGVLISKMTMSSDNEQMNAQLSMLGEIESTTYFKGEKGRFESSNPMSGETVTISDNEAKMMMLLMNNPMSGKMYSKTSTDLSEEDLKGITVTKGTETKTVLGYKCDQYLVSVDVQGQQMEMELFTTLAFKAYSQATANLGTKVEGFPLYYVITMNQGPAKMIITNEITDIKQEKVSDDKFDMTPPEGYEEIKQ